MLLGGDELGRTQKGNNNAYCQDNEISWYHWDLAETNAEQVEFTRRLIQLRSGHRIFRRRRWFEGRSIRGSDERDIAWFTPQATLMSDEDWDVGYARSLGVFLNGKAIPEPDVRGEHVVDDTFLWLFNAGSESLSFSLPAEEWGSAWSVLFDTSEPGGGVRRGRIHLRRGEDAEAEGPLPGAAQRVTDLAATYRLQLRAGLRLRRRRQPVPTTSPLSASATSTARRTCRRRRAARTATTWSTTTGSTRRSEGPTDTLGSTGH